MAAANVDVTLNAFNDSGLVVGTTNMDLTTAQVSDIVDHAAQLILVADTVDDFESADFAAVLANLREALEAAGVV